MSKWRYNKLLLSAGIWEYRKLMFWSWCCVRCYIEVYRIWYISYILGESHTMFCWGNSFILVMLVQRGRMLPGSGYSWGR